jgi:hypothetical protein
MPQSRALGTLFLYHGGPSLECHCMLHLVTVCVIMLGSQRQPLWRPLLPGPHHQRVQCQPRGPGAARPLPERGACQRARVPAHNQRARGARRQLYRCHDAHRGQVSGRHRPGAGHRPRVLAFYPRSVLPRAQRSAGMHGHRVVGPPLHLARKPDGRTHDLRVHAQRPSG